MGRIKPIKVVNIRSTEDRGLNKEVYGERNKRKKKQKGAPVFAIVKTVVISRK